MKLINRSRNLEIANTVGVADSFLSRAIGLMGRRNFPQGHALWFKGSALIPCNSIQTSFMRFPIDAVFVDRNLIVKAVYEKLNPWRMTKPALGATDVFELPAGTLQSSHVAVGDQLYVGD